MSAAVPSTPALAWLDGMRVQRVDGPSPGLFALTLFHRGDKLTLLLMLGPSPRGVGAVRERPHGDAASAFVRRLRTLVEGARVRGLHWLRADEASERAQALALDFARGEQLQRLVVDFDPRSPNLYIVRDDHTLAGASDERGRRERFAKDAPYTPRSGGGIVPLDSADALFAAGESLLANHARKSDDSARTRVQSQTRALLKRAERKAEAIRGDLARAGTAPTLRREAELLLCNLSAISRGASSARLYDETTEPAVWRDIALDPAVDAARNAELRFERARKLDRGVAIAESRLRDAEAEVARLRELLARTENEDADAVTASAQALGVALPDKPAGRPKPQQRTPYRTFFSADGARILVGKGGADNDTLTLTVARPHDHWLHVRGTPGAHVVVPLTRGAQIAQELLLDAAHLAAHFSKIRGEPAAEIAHTARRFVRKLKGSAPGSVQVDRERVFVLRIEATRLQRLLASERT
ncbi:MAG: NFACT RNA binding domain-containing protein [Polyangiales bacterium]